MRQLTNGIAGLFKANKVEGLVGHGKLLADRKIEFKAVGGKTETIEAENVIIATGSTPIELPFAKFDHESIVDSWDALEFSAVPKRLGIIGAGVIGLELGSVWQRLGAEVTISRLCMISCSWPTGRSPPSPARTSRSRGWTSAWAPKLTGAKAGKTGVTVEYEDKGVPKSFEVDKLIVAVGRRPYTEGLLAADSGIQLDEKGFIVVDGQCRTRVKRVFAIGDCVRGPMLAHKGSEEGVMVADLIAGEIAEMNYDVIPSVIYTAPEIAWVGQTEQEVKESGREYKTGSFPFAASGRAKAMEQTVGMVKIVSAVEDDEVLGVHIIGPMAGELISEAVLAMEFSASTRGYPEDHPRASQPRRGAARGRARGRRARAQLSQQVATRIARDRGLAANAACRCSAGRRGRGCATAT